MVKQSTIITKEIDDDKGETPKDNTENKKIINSIDFTKKSNINLKIYEVTV